MFSWASICVVVRKGKVVVAQLIGFVEGWAGWMH